MVCWEKVDCWKNRATRDRLNEKITFRGTVQKTAVPCGFDGGATWRSRVRGDVARWGRRGDEAARVGVVAGGKEGREMSTPKNIKFRGTERKTAVQCGFRECRWEVAECRVPRRCGLSRREKVEWRGDTTALDRVLLRMVGSPGACGVFIIQSRLKKVWTHHGCGDLFGGEWNSATPRG